MTEQELQDLTDELTTKFEAHSQKFIGKYCNYVNGVLLEHSLNNILSSYVNDSIISSASRVKLNLDNTDYENKTFAYDASIIALGETERVQINLIFEAVI